MAWAQSLCGSRQCRMPKREPKSRALGSDGLRLWFQFDSAWFGMRFGLVWLSLVWFHLGSEPRLKDVQAPPERYFCKIPIHPVCKIIDIILCSSMLIYRVIDISCGFANLRIEIAHRLVTFQVSIACYRLLPFVRYIDISNESNDIVVEFVDITYGLLWRKIAVIGCMLSTTVNIMNRYQ